MIKMRVKSCVPYTTDESGFTKGETKLLFAISVDKPIGGIDGLNEEELKNLVKYIEAYGRENEKTPEVLKQVKAISATMETRFELDCDKRFVEEKSKYFTLTLVEDGSFEYVIKYPTDSEMVLPGQSPFNAHKDTAGYAIMEKGRIGFGLARLLKKYSLVAEIIKGLSKQAYDEVITDCKNIYNIGKDF
jgi:hypothetical protein